MTSEIVKMNVDVVGFIFGRIAEFELFQDPNNVDWATELNKFNEQKGLAITPKELLEQASGMAKRFEARGDMINYKDHVEITWSIHDQLFPDESESE